jgi:glycosyltransferase involved in cell wall biosynthesis
MPNTNSTKSTITKTQPFAIYAGAVNEGRGLELLAEIAPKSPIPITICGDGDLYSHFSTSEIKQLTFTGFLPPAILQEKIQQAYLGMLILNPNSPSYYYSLANKFFDYIQAGIPVIFPPLPEYLSLNAEIEVGIPCEYNAAAILAAIHLLTTDTQLYQKLQANTQIAAKIWNWQNEEQVLLQLYKNL